jgi:YD repeat-containing protein
MTAAVDPRGHELGANPSDYTTTYTRYVYGEVVSVSDPLGHSATVTYDVAGNRTQTADALGRVTQYTYDAAGNLLTSTFPNGWRDERAYDRADTTTCWSPTARAVERTGAATQKGAARSPRRRPGPGRMRGVRSARH